MSKFDDQAASYSISLEALEECFENTPDAEFIATYEHIHEQNINCDSITIDEFLESHDPTYRWSRYRWSSK